jgi:hypothetical protein
MMGCQCRVQSSSRRHTTFVALCMSIEQSRFEGNVQTIEENKLVV